MTTPRLRLTRSQILAFRRQIGGLDRRLPRGARSLRRAAWAGLQDSMPRAALFSINARVADTRPTTWEDRSLVQLWGPRYSVFVIAAQDRAVFSLGRLPDDVGARRAAEGLADRLEGLLGETTMTYREAGRALGEHPNWLRYAAPTGRVLVRWEGAGPPVIWTVAAPDVDPRDARLELARRYIHVFGPTTPAAFATWAGIDRPAAEAAFDVLGRSLAAVRTPIGDAWILASDESAFLADPVPAAPARLLPSGDAYYLAQGEDRKLLVTKAHHRSLLWTPRVWPGAVMVRGNIVGTWRRSQAKVTIETWRPLSRTARAAVEAEAASLPVPGITGDIKVSWVD